MPSLKQVGASGQITIGKKYAGQTVQVIEEPAAGKVTLLFGKFTPAHEQWIHKESHLGKLNEAIRYDETDVSLRSLAEGIDLKSMLEKITPENIHRAPEEEDSSIGKEVW